MRDLSLSCKFAPGKDPVPRIFDVIAEWLTDEQHTVLEGDARYRRVGFHTKSRYRRSRPVRVYTKKS